MKFFHYHSYSPKTQRGFSSRLQIGKYRWKILETEKSHSLTRLLFYNDGGSILIFADSKYSRNSLRRANATNFSFDLVKRVTPRGTKTVAGNGRFSGPAYERKQETNGPRHSRDWSFASTLVS